MKKPSLRQVMGITTVILAAVGAGLETVGKQRKEAEFENMKKQLAELSKNKEGEA